MNESEVFEFLNSLPFMTGRTARLRKIKQQFGLNFKEALTIYESWLYEGD